MAEAAVAEWRRYLLDASEGSCPAAWRHARLRGMTTVALEAVIIVLLVLVNGLLAMSEMAVVAARKERLRRQADRGDRGAVAALALAEQPGRFLSAVQIGITLVGILAGAFGGATLALQIERWLEAVPALAPYANALAIGVVVLAITFLSLVVGELAPKQIALANPERVAAATAPAMTAIARVASPVVSLLAATTDLLLRLLPIRDFPENRVTPEEVRQLIVLGGQEGVFDTVQQAVLERAIGLGERRLTGLMTPRTEIVWLDLDASPEHLVQQVAASPHAHFPVARGRLDRVVGTVRASELLAAVLGGAEPDVEALMQPPVFLPETLGAFAALERLGAVGQSVGMVIDEHGGVEGLVSVTDVAGALVGDLAPLVTDREPEIVARADGTWLVDGTLAADALRELLHLESLPDEGEFETVSGLCMALASRIPATGDRFEVGPWLIEVVDMDGRRVDKVLVAPGSHRDTSGQRA